MIVCTEVLTVTFIVQNANSTVHSLLHSTLLSLNIFYGLVKIHLNYNSTLKPTRRYFPTGHWLDVSSVQKKQLLC